MYKIPSLSVILLLVFGASLYAQPNNNGTLDNIEEFSTKFTVPFVMPDGIILYTDIFLPITQDSLVVKVKNSTVSGIDPILGPLLAGLVGSNDLNIELIRKGTQIWVYDSIWDNQQGKYVPNPNIMQLPMVFTRTPYNKRGDIVGNIVSLMGYAYALQDMRGRYQSQGVYFPMYSDSWNKNAYHPNYAHVLDISNLNDPTNSNRHEDGYNSINYIVDSLYWAYDFDMDGVIDTVDKLTNGSIGMFGASALGNTQYQAAAAHRIDPLGPGLKSLLPIVATLEHYRFTGYQNGVFRERIVTGWLKGQIFDIDDEDIQFDTGPNDSIHSAADYGLNNKFEAAALAIDHFVTVRYNGGTAGYYPNSPGRVDMDASVANVNQFGEATDPVTQLPLPDLNYSRYTNMEVPQYHLTGWWDIFTDGQIETYNLLMSNLSDTYGNKKKQKLVIGPWAHQTIGSTKTGDMTYKDNVVDLIGINIGDINLDELDVSKVLTSEIISWFRYNLNYNDYKNIGLPTARIPESPIWQDVAGNGSILVRVPSEDYRLSFEGLVNLLLGKQDLNQIPLEIKVPSLGINQSLKLDLAAEDIFDGPLLPEFVSDQLNAKIDSVNFEAIPNVRVYVVGPNDDGVPENENVGNYWRSAEHFPFKEEEGIRWQELYFHKDGALNTLAPQTDEGFGTYVHDPNDPLLTHGGANMIVRTPDGNRDSQGQMDFSDPLYINQVMNRTGILHYETEVVEDSLCIIGFPKMTLYAKTNPGGSMDGPTDTDFFIRVLDVYPDGREFFVVEGCVNARARDYARHLADKDPYEPEDVNVPFSNIEIGSIYEYHFMLMPIAYTWGKGHKMKILVSSSNYNRYQVNPNLPLHDGEFFRRQPADGKTYVFEGRDMEPRIAVQRIAHSPEHPTRLSLPIYKQEYVGLDKEPIAKISALDAVVYPNPTSDMVNIFANTRELLNVRVYNQLGQSVYEGSFQDNIVIETNQYEPGMYFIELSNAQERIVKKLSVF